MATKITSFKSDSGKVFENALDAWLEDLDFWLSSSEIDNPAIRVQLAKAIRADINNGNHLTKIIKGITDSSPVMDAVCGL